MRKMTLLALVLAVMTVFSVATDGYSYSYGCWVGMTGANTVAVNPFYSMDFDGSGTASLTAKLDFGVTDSFDFMMDFTSLWFMGRYDLLGNNLAILGVSLDPSAAGLQIDGIYDDADMWAIEYNVGATYSYAGDFGYAVLVAETLKLGDFGLWVEEDYDGAFNLNAGIYANIGDSQLSVGATGLTSGSYGIGAWWWQPFAF